MTLKSLYLDPLQDLARGQGTASTRSGWQPQLLIDIKSDGESTYAAIEQELAEHGDIMSRYSHGTTKTGRVTVVISETAAGHHAGTGEGASAPTMAAPNPLRQACRPDAAVSQLDQALHLAGRGSHAGGRARQLHATWPTRTPMATAPLLGHPGHAGNERGAIWNGLFNAGVVRINTDDLAALQQAPRPRRLTAHLEPQPRNDSLRGWGLRCAA